MEYNKNDIITLENDHEYVVADVVKIENINYLYLIDNDDNNDECLLLKENIINNESILGAVTDDEEFNKVFTKLAINNKNTIMEYIGE